MGVTRCPECGSYNLKVTDSRDHDGDIWRTRVCSDCGERIYSIEVERYEYRKSREILNVYKQISGAFKKLEEIENGKK